METMSEKVGAMGGNMGDTFDDGIFDGVKKIVVGKDFDGVTYIKTEYEKDGKFESREHGTIRGELKEFTVDYPDEYITSVGGSYEHVFNYRTVLIKSLIFKTSYGRTSPILGHTTLFGNPAGKEFMLEGKNGGKLLGFHGRSGQALDAIGPHFFAVNSPLKHFNRQGGNGGNAWDDGAYDGVRKVLVGRSGKFVSYVRFEYAQGERMVPHAHGKKQEVPQEFVVDYPNEHITLVEGTIDGYLSSLTFKTSKGRTSPAFGNVVGKKFVFEEKGFKLVGFCGRSGDAIDALGAHFAPLPAPAPAPAPAPIPTPTPAPTPAPDSSSSSSLTPPNTGGYKPVVPGTEAGGGSNSGSDSSTQKVEAQGGKGSNEWDDGGDHEGVMKIYVAVGRAVEQIKIDYLKNGQTKEGPAHGLKGSRSSISTIEISHPEEYLLSVKGWFDSSNKILGIQFTTNTKTSDYLGFEKYPGEEGTDFSLEVKDKKIVGFHGFADSYLNSLGAYFAPITATPLKPGKKLEAIGGDGGAAWDDGAFDGVRKIHVGQNNDGVCFVTIEYNKGSQTVYGEGHGKKSPLGVETFELKYPGEYIEAVGIYYDRVQIEQQGVTLVTSLIFKTNKQESAPFGMTGGEYVELKEQGHKIVGFHGKASDWVHQIGVYVAPITN